MLALRDNAVIFELMHPAKPDVSMTRDNLLAVVRN